MKIDSIEICDRIVTPLPQQSYIFHFITYLSPMHGNTIPGGVQAFHGVTRPQFHTDGPCILQFPSPDRNDIRIPTTNPQYMALIFSTFRNNRDDEAVNPDAYKYSVFKTINLWLRPKVQTMVSNYRDPTHPHDQVRQPPENFLKEINNTLSSVLDTYIFHSKSRERPTTLRALMLPPKNLYRYGVKYNAP